MAVDITLASHQELEQALADFLATSSLYSSQYSPNG